MTAINLSMIQGSAPGLTQKTAIGAKEDHLPTGALAAPAMFTSTYMASQTGDFLFAVGKGHMDAQSHATLLLQYAYDKNLNFQSLASEYINTLGQIGFSRSFFMKMVAVIVGSSERTVRTNSIPVVTPTFIYEHVSKFLPSLEHAIIKHMITDFICHMFGSMGWIADDSAYVYRIKRTQLFPRFSHLLDIVEAYDVLRTLRILADADLYRVKKQISEGGVIVPTVVSAGLANAVTTAYETSRGSYDSQQVVVSTLTTLARIWDPVTPEALEPSIRVRRAAPTAQLQSNLALFLAAQDMMRSSVETTIAFTDEEMASTVLPEFVAAMQSISPFKLLPLTDTTAHFGKRSVRGLNDQPGHIVLYEDWDFTESVTGFTPIKQTPTGEQRFLVPHSTVSNQLHRAMEPVRSVLNLDRLVDQRIQTFEMAPLEQRVPKNGVELHLAFPSLMEMEVARDLPSGFITKALKAGKYAPELDISEDIFDALQYDYRAMITHVAVAKMPSVSIAAHATDESPRPNLFLIWNERTRLRMPVGQSQIVHGEISTAEPLEILAYADDFNPLSSLRVEEIDLEKHRRSVHIWGWHEASTDMNRMVIYPITIRNNSYKATIYDHEAFGLGMRRELVRMLRPTMATAICRTWVEWMADERRFLTTSAKATKDEIARDGYNGRKIQSALFLANSLVTIGSSSAGTHAISLAKQRLTDAMYDQGTIDDSTELTVGIQERRLHVWAGLVILQFLTLCDTEMATELMDYMKETNALALMVSHTSLPH